MQNGAQAAGDRFTYLALLAPVTLLACGVVLALRKLRAPGRIALATLVICEICFFGYTTRAQIPVWRNDVTLWNEALTRFPNSALANYMMANGLARQKRYEQALPVAQKAVTLSPNFARAHYRLACIYSRLGRTQDALDALHQAVAYDAEYSRQAQQDDDLKNLRDDPRLASQFRRLVTF
jgi:tetratricopeptide (TPR) repeat protein